MKFNSDVRVLYETYINAADREYRVLSIEIADVMLECRGV